MHLTAYAAGSDVFFPDAAAFLRRKVALCAERGIRLRTPLDAPIDLAQADAGRLIYRSNRQIMLDCDVVIANLSPFRGPSADDGTAFEVGFFDALRRPAFAYGNEAGTLAERTRTFLLTHPDPADFAVEDFGLDANLMLPSAVLDRGGLPLFTPRGASLEFDDLTLFAALVAAVAERCAPIMQLRRAANAATGRPGAVDAALRLARPSLDGATLLEAVLRDPGRQAEFLALLLHEA